MKRSENGAENRKLSVQQVSKYFTTTRFKSNDFGLISLKRFIAPPEGVQIDIDGIWFVVVCSGSARADVNGKSCELFANSVALLDENSKLSSIKCSKACTGYVVSFSYPFVNKSVLDVSDFMALKLKCNNKPVVIVADEDIERLHRLSGILSDIVYSSDKYAYNDKIAASLFSSVFYMFMSVLKQSTEPIREVKRVSRPDKLLQEFIELLNEECERERSVEFYANKLNITSKYLSLICRNKMGRSASIVIEEAVIRKAKELLMQTGLSIQDVSQQLNFVSQSFFGKYFKQRVGISPSRYKSQSL